MTGILEQHALGASLASLGRRAAVCVAPGTSVRAAMETMAAKEIGSVVVADESGRGLGIFTRSDILKRVVIPEIDSAVAIEQVMSPQPACIGVQATVYDAMLAMATRGVRHLLVVDPDQRVVSVISERDLFALQRIGLRNVQRLIAAAGNMDEVRQAAADVRKLCFSLLSQGVNAEKLTQFISGLNDALTERVIALASAAHGLEDAGCGISWAWLAFGSEGRGEQTFSTDQDNGIVFACEDGRHDDAAARLLSFAQQVNADLATCGFPLCKGGIMAGNPLWCLSFQGWQARFQEWIRVPEPEALLNATIFFDFRALHGSRELEQGLKVWLLDSARDSGLFLRLMADNALRASPPLGRIRDFVYDGNAEFPKTLDLKAFGARLFVDAARVLALANGVEASGTAERLRALVAKERLNADDANAMIDGFYFIQQLRLRKQKAVGTPGGENRVAPRSLNALDRKMLIESFRQARALQTRLQLDYRL